MGMLRALFLTSVELSRACSQLNGDPCLPIGTLEPVNEEYGGDVVTFPLFAMAALRCGLFLKDFSTAHHHDANTAGQGTAAHHHHHAAQGHGGLVRPGMSGRR